MVKVEVWKSRGQVFYRINTGDGVFETGIYSVKFTKKSHPKIFFNLRRPPFSLLPVPFKYFTLYTNFWVKEEKLERMYDNCMIASTIYLISLLKKG